MIIKKYQSGSHQVFVIIQIIEGIESTKKEMPILKNDERMYVDLQGSLFQQINALNLINDHVINKNVINTYIVYKLDRDYRLDVNY